VENKEKVDYLNQLYTSMGRSVAFDKVLSTYDSSDAMNELNSILGELNKLEKLNNNNIPRMVKDNVRYGGEEIPVDLILSEFAENFGFDILKIFVLPRGKGNSSQQMGN